LFNNNGELVAIGTSKSLGGGIHHREARFIQGYGSLLDDIFENITLMLPALGGDGPLIGTKIFAP
jgi:hypothetical protein